MERRLPYSWETVLMEMTLAILKPDTVEAGNAGEELMADTIRRPPWRSAWKKLFTA